MEMCSKSLILEFIVNISDEKRVTRCKKLERLQQIAHCL